MAAPASGAALLRPSAPTMGPPQGRLELQPMALQPGQQARQLTVQPFPATNQQQPPQPPAPTGLPAAAQPSLDTGFEDRQIRNRVICISLAIAVYVVLGTFLQYYFDIAALQEAMAKVHSVAKLPGRHVDLFSLMMNTFPQVGWSIAIGLLVPLCGYLGVKQNNPGLMGCFCSCNALHCCCGLVSMVTMLAMVTGFSAAAPGVVEFLDRCDPIHCAPRGLNSTARERVVDCLAASTWEGYKSHFEHTPRLSPECPKIFLICEASGEEPGPGADTVDIVGVRKPGLRGAPPPWLPRRLGVFRKPLLSTADSEWRQEQQRRRRHWRPEPPPQPADPIASCEPAESVEMFHKARLLAPELLPKLVLFFTVKLILMIPFVVLGCFGFCWGKEMWLRLGQGYSHLLTPGNAPAPSGVQLQPLAGFAVAPASTEAQLAQPLMLNAPPPVVALQQVANPVGQHGQATGSPAHTDQE